MIALDDRGFTLGDGLFETVLALAGELQAIDRHLARLRSSAEAIGLSPTDPDKAVAAMRAAITQAGLGKSRAAVRLTYSAGPGGRGLERPVMPSPVMVAVASASPLWEGPARLAVSTIRRNEGAPSSRFKTLSYIDNIMARREAMERGAQEAVLLNHAGHVAGAAAGNLFWLDGDVLCTPSIECGALPGVMRAQVIEAALAEGRRVREDRFQLAALQAGRDLFITNALIGRRPAIFPDA